MASEAGSQAGHKAWNLLSCSFENLHIHKSVVDGRLASHPGVGFFDSSPSDSDLWLCESLSLCRVWL